MVDGLLWASELYAFTRALTEEVGTLTHRIRFFISAPCGVIKEGMLSGQFNTYLGLFLAVAQG